MSSSQESLSPPGLAGSRVLVVEDEVAISLLLEDMLLELGCEIAGSAGRLDAALNLARTAELDLAILDVNLGGQPIYPVADVLNERGIRFIFSTGYGLVGIEEAYRSRPMLQKPFSQAELAKQLGLLVATG